MLKKMNEAREAHWHPSRFTNQNILISFEPQFPQLILVPIGNHQQIVIPSVEYRRQRIFTTKIVLNITILRTFPIHDFRWRMRRSVDQFPIVLVIIVFARIVHWIFEIVFHIFVIDHVHFAIDQTCITVMVHWRPRSHRFIAAGISFEIAIVCRLEVACGFFTLVFWHIRTTNHCLWLFVCVCVSVEQKKWCSSVGRCGNN